MSFEAVLYDREAVEFLKKEQSLFRLLSWVYRSNWRVLRIDGFEGGRRIPMSAGITRQFFNYEVKNG
jgi:hypothetical protein